MMRVSVVHPGELGAPEVARWHDILRASPAPANPFLCPEFTIAVGRRRSQARVAVLSDGPDVVGFFPFERRGLGYGVPIGAGHNDCQGLVHLPGLDWEPQQLLRACGLAVWEFDHLVDGQKPFQPYQDGRHSSPIMDLSAGFDPFLAKLREGPNRLRDISRKQRKLAREVGELRFAFDERDARLLSTLMRWKSAQYIRTGDRDRFARGWIVDLLEDLLATRTEGFSAALSILYAGDQPVAGHFGLRSDQVMAHWFPAYDPDFAGYSPGLAMHLHLAEGAAATGVHHIDMGTGTEGYKQWFRSRDVVVAQGRVVRGSSGAALHWLRRAPMEQVYRVVDDNPSLSRTAKRVRAGYERIASARHRRSITDSPGAVTENHPPSIGTVT